METRLILQKHYNLTLESIKIVKRIKTRAEQNKKCLNALEILLGDCDKIACVSGSVSSVRKKLQVFYRVSKQRLESAQKMLKASECEFGKI